MAHKKCTKCGHSVGVRTKECPMCGNPFIKVAKISKVQHVIKHDKMIDVCWKHLKENDIIFVYGRSGPYYKTSKGYTFIGEKGVYKVNYLDGLGIHASPLKGKLKGGHRFIYMGKCEETSDGVFRSPHRIKKVIIND